MKWFKIAMFIIQVVPKVVRQVKSILDEGEEPESEVEVKKKGKDEEEVSEDGSE